MAGGSYGGGIQLVTAGLDKRVDAIVPDIAWQSLVTSLYKDENLKMGWGTLLTAAGNATGRLDRRINSAFTQGSTTGKIPETERQWFASRGPGAALVDKIRIPTMLTQGTVDTLFTLREAEANYRILKRNKVPVKMMWHCGGHGTCDFPAGQPGRVEDAMLKWFDRYLKRNTGTDTGAGFEWIDDQGTWHTSAGYPLTPRAPLTGSGRGTLPLSPALTTGSPTDAMSGSPNVEIPVGAPKGIESVVGSPDLELSYSGTASPAQTFVYAQVVDKRSGQVAGQPGHADPRDARRHGAPRLAAAGVDRRPGRAGLTARGPARARDRALRAPALDRRDHPQRRQGQPAHRRPRSRRRPSSSRSARSRGPRRARCASASARCASACAPAAARCARSPSWSSAASAWWPSRAASTRPAAASPRCASSRAARKGTYTVVAAGKDAAGRKVRTTKKFRLR